MVHVWIAQTIGLKELCNNIHESEYQNGVKLLNHFWVVCFWRGHRNLWTLTLFYFFSSSAWNCFYLPPTRLTLFVMCRSFPCTEHWALQFLSAWLQLNFLMFINQPKWAKKITGQNGQKWTHAAPQYASSWNNTKIQGWFLQCFDLRALQDFLF